jgi:hypothetical protein
MYFYHFHAVRYSEKSTITIKLHLSLDLRTSDLRLFATNNHVNLYLFSIYENYFRYNEESINFLWLLYIQ